jgi:N-acetylglucosamine-6-phosphate deacetylase
VSGAKPLGIHLEGPFIHPERLGGFGKQYLQPPSVELFKQYQAAAKGHIKMVTLAPELEGIEAVIRHLVEERIVVSAGHTMATYEEMVRAIDLGVSHVTHMYNAMSPFTHRSPGVVGAALLDPDVSLQIIADGAHLHPATVKLTVEQAGVDRIALITDAMHMLGLSDGHYSSFGHEVELRMGQVQLADGTLAGSVLTMNHAVRNAMQFAEIPLHEAVRMATIVPATILGIHNRKGSLEAGKDADIVLMDEAFNVHLTMVEGEIVYQD